MQVRVRVPLRASARIRVHRRVSAVSSQIILATVSSQVGVGCVVPNNLPVRCLSGVVPDNSWRAERDIAAPSLLGADKTDKGVTPAMAKHLDSEM